MSGGAGVVVVKKIGKEYKVLCLFENKKSDKRKYDLTKGAIDSGEGVFSTATRETYEEAGIRNLKFRWGRCFLKSGGITMFLAETPDTPEIVANPKSGIIEHDGFEWNQFETAYVLMPKYLKPFILWANKIINGELDVKI